MYDLLKHKDTEVFGALSNEFIRQNEKIELIASENFVSPEVMEAQGSVLTNKYAEGYPGKRYYGGCEWVDVAEDLARNRLKELFGAEYVNVQPHSGSSANLAVYMTFIKPGDKVMGLSLAHGGHLTHGSPVNFSGKLYDFTAYELDPATGYIDYDKAWELAKLHKPKLITVGASAYPRDIDFAKFREIADSIGAFLFADIAHPAGLIAKGKLNNPLPYCDVVSSTTHKTLRGPRGGIIMTQKNYDNPFGLVAPKSGRTKSIGEVIDSWVMPGIQGGPLMHVIAAKAVAFGEALSEDFGLYTEQIIKNAQAMAGVLTHKGYNLVSGGTDNHLMLVDLRNKGVTGKQAENALDAAGITCNKNAVPNDNQSPLVTSGIRLGAPAMTSRGLKEDDFKVIAEFIDRVITDIDNSKLHNDIKNEVKEFTSKFPLYQNMK
ncbi:MAG TPA: serine hydroxymethyltransferase [Candidatus Kapabacteria bacterium]|nr:serine hydroxymethyltransferase [Candidatus Kapabacteria bacterium]